MSEATLLAQVQVLQAQLQLLQVQVQHLRTELAQSKKAASDLLWAPGTYQNGA